MATKASTSPDANVLKLSKNDNGFFILMTFALHIG